MNALFSWITGSCLLLVCVFLFINFSEFELKTYESGISSYFFSGIISRLLLCILIVSAVFIFLHRANKAIPIIAIVSLSIIGFVVFFGSNNSIISLTPSFIFSSKLKLASVFILSYFGLILTYFYPHRKKLKSLSLVLSKYILSIGLITVLFAFNPLFPEEFQDISIKSLTNNQQKALLKIEATESDKLMAFFTTSCPYCELAAKKLSLLAKNESHFPEIFIYFAGSEEGVASFFQDTKTKFDYQLIETNTFLKITEGSFPKMIVYSKDKSPVYLSGKSFNYKVVDIIDSSIK